MKKKTARKKRKGQSKRDAKSQKGKTWILEGMEKGIEEKLWQTTYPVFIPVHTGVLA